MTAPALAHATPRENVHQVRCPVCHALEFEYEGPVGNPVAIRTRCHRCRAWYEGDLQSDGPRLRVTPQ